MDPLILAVIVVVLAYAIGVALVPKEKLNEPNSYTKQMLNNLKSDNASLLDASSAAEQQHTIIKEDEGRPSLLLNFFLAMPGGKTAYQLMRRSRMHNPDVFFIILLGIFFLIVYKLKSLGVMVVPLAAGVSYLLGRYYLKKRIKKQNIKFMEFFPDALNIIARSVRAGYPLNTAIRIVSENLSEPVCSEFQQVADEVAYGRSLTDALQNLAKRIDEPDVQFFIVVLSVQQEVGGNLAEVLSNLASIIRKRRQLKMKVKAMTSEGRTTGWILGGLPFFVAGVIQFMSPTHLLPLFYTTTGNMVLVGALCMIAMGAWLVGQIVNVDI